MKQDEIRWIKEEERVMYLRQERRQLRTKSVHTCGICGTKTNRWTVMYFMGYPSLRLTCPYHNDGGPGTNELNRKHTKLQALQDRLFDDKALTRSEINEIKVEILEFLRFFRTLKGDVVVLESVRSIEMTSLAASIEKAEKEEGPGGAINVVDGSISNLYISSTELPALNIIPHTHMYRKVSHAEFQALVKRLRGYLEYGEIHVKTFDANVPDILSRLVGPTGIAIQVMVLSADDSSSKASILQDLSLLTTDYTETWVDSSEASYKAVTTLQINERLLVCHPKADGYNMKSAYTNGTDALFKEIVETAIIEPVDAKSTG
jgi:hypothetical protein